jgi:uroporphyrinogen decarboxylase
MKQWTSRTRVLASINHEEPDRIPISFGGTGSTGILECPPQGKNYTRLCQYLGIENYEPPETGYAFNYVSNIDERILTRFGSDLRRVDGNPPEVRFESDGSKTVLGVLCGMRIRKMGYYDDVFEFPLRDCQTKKDLDHYPFWPTSEDFRKLAEGKREEVKHLSVVVPKFRTVW